MLDSSEGIRKVPRKLDGTVLTMNDLPPATWPEAAAEDGHVWTAQDKANVVAAVRAGLISWGEASKRWRLSEDEYLSWEAVAKTHGRSGLHGRALIGAGFNEHRNLGRRGEGKKSEEVLKSGPFMLYPKMRRVTCGAFEAYLDPKEWRLFALLIGRKGATVSRAEIEEKLGPQAVSQTVGRIRTKLSYISGGKLWIRTNRGSGWMYTGVPLE